MFQGIISKLEAVDNAFTAIRTFDLKQYFNDQWIAKVEAQRIAKLNRETNRLFNLMNNGAKLTNDGLLKDSKYKSYGHISEEVIENAESQGWLLRLPTQFVLGVDDIEYDDHKWRYCFVDNDYYTDLCEYLASNDNARIIFNDKKSRYQLVMAKVASSNGFVSSVTRGKLIASVPKQYIYLLSMTGFLVKNSYGYTLSLTARESVLQPVI